MIDDSDFSVIEPKSDGEAYSSAQVMSGIPIPKPTRVANFSPDEWEDFTLEWASSIEKKYSSVRRFGGAGDYGIDIAGFFTDSGLNDKWDNYQCKRYDHALYPTDVWVEIGKIVYYSFKKEYIPPDKHYFIASRGIGTTLERLLKNPSELRRQFLASWDQYCRTRITSTEQIELAGDLKDYAEAFDYSIFTSKSHLELIEEHSNTHYHTVRFGGGLPPRPATPTPPVQPAPQESRYVRQLLNAYGDHLSVEITDSTSLAKHGALNSDFARQRERFYHAEALKNFSRDNVPPGTFENLQDEMYDGIIDVVESAHEDGYERLRATLRHATTIALTSNPLVSVTKTQDRQGICHQLANDDRVNWVDGDDEG